MLIDEIKKYNLKGRSGSRFPVYKKWESLALTNSSEKFLICNGAEGEFGVYKDKYILEKHPESVVNGILITMESLNINKGFIYLKPDYFDLFAEKLNEIIGTANIKIELKQNKYIAGEETAAIRSIEGKRAEPYQKPPYPTEKGLWGKPTLIHNVETFFAIAEIGSNKYKNERFYCIEGDVENKGIFKISEDYTVKQVLEETKNYPKFDFIIQLGGGTSGIFLEKNEIDVNCDRLGSIKVIRKDLFNPYKEIEIISEILVNGNCDKCTPCREGIFRILEISKKDLFNQDIFEDMIFVLLKSSYCPLGRAAGEVFESLKRFI